MSFNDGINGIQLLGDSTTHSLVIQLLMRKENCFLFCVLAELNEGRGVLNPHSD
jgi:hypothetical protein